MKKTLRISVLTSVMMLAVFAVEAQQVNTLYFLDNAPVRHYINPAFQPISKMYLSFPIIGYTSLQFGNNSLTMSDLLYKDPTTGKTITPLHPNGDRNKFLNTLRSVPSFTTDDQFNLLSFGFRLKENGYFHFTINEKIESGLAYPKELFNFALLGGMNDVTSVNTFNLSSLGFDAYATTELGIGVAWKINDHWSIGGKLKFLLGNFYLGMSNNDLKMSLSKDEWTLRGTGSTYESGFLHLPSDYSSEGLKNYSPFGDLFANGFNVQDLLKAITPSGYGGAIDLGLTYKPIKQLQISAGVTDLGFIHWSGGKRVDYTANGSFTGVGEFDYNKYMVDGTFDADSLEHDAIRNLENVLSEAITIDTTKTGFTRRTTARLNVGIDANFWDNRVGIGIYSNTRFFNSHIYEEVTIGAAFRPVHWFNIAVSYSLIENGKYSDIGAALGLVTYEGIGLFVAADYIPTTYAKIPTGNTNSQGNPTYIPMPYKTKGLNLAFGLNIVIGHRSQKDQDKDGVFDKFDLCPETPKGVVVDEVGCPIDSDGDGVPDYLDECPDTPSAARGMVDEHGCPLDTDGDGVYDYEDMCNDTPAEAGNMVDDQGCPLDTDGDGVYDYKDECPDTPSQAYGFVDEFGCVLDTDGDGVPDYLDECPDTPQGAAGMVDNHGCPLDSDGDGVYDYMDECPDTPRQAFGFVDEYGCLLDGDKDGVPDYKDHCPDTPEEERANVNEWGCTNDTDRDGVPDNIDRCPNTPQGVRVDEWGCPVDTDGDGIADYLDQCPTIPGDKANNGCPTIKKEVRNLLKKAMQGIQFETGKAIIKPTSRPILNQIADVFIDNPTYRVEVQGHTDNVGKAEYNQDLSERRAQAVRSYLISAGVPESQLTARGYGLTMPIADNATAAGRAQNRRVEFVISFEEVTYEEIQTKSDDEAKANMPVTEDNRSNTPQVEENQTNETPIE